MTESNERRLSLLLVEDDRSDAQFVERLLWEYQSTMDAEGTSGLVRVTDVTHVGTLADAVDRCGDESPDVVLLDLQLPDSEGIETVERMTSEAPATAIVVLTGLREREVGVEAIQRGAAEYLSKGSITAESLRRAIRYAVARNRNERVLRDRTHQLAMVNRILRRDIRDDASMIIGLGDQLRAEVDGTTEETVETLLDAATHVVDQTDTAAELTDALVGIDVDREPTDLEAALEAEVSRIRRSHDATVSLETPDEGPVYVHASPMLGAVFRHLLVNAVTHTERTSPTVAVRVEPAPDSVVVTVADDGVGIPEEQRTLLEDPDARFDDRSGMGVGLYLVTMLVERFDGSVEFGDSQRGGTEVTVTFDRA